MDIPQWIVAHFLAILGYLLAIILIPRILLERRHPGATIAWLLAIGLIPFLGVPVYFLIGGRKIKKISEEKNWNFTRKRSAAQVPDEYGLSATSRGIAHLLMRTGSFPPARDNRITIIDDGVTAYTRLVDLLENAREFIEIATFILGRDEVGRALVDLLAQKAKQGVEVRLLLDALGCLRTRGRFVLPLKDTGGQVGVFQPLLPLRRQWSANLRNHRKIAIVDGHQAIVGGMNLTREYLGPHPYHKRWKDVSVVITGSGVEHVRTIFRQDWQYSTGERPETGISRSDVPCQTPNESILQVVGDGPGIPERPFYSGVLAALHQARESIWVVTPYFVPDDPQDVRGVTRVMEGMIRESREITREELEQKSKIRTFSEDICRVFLPLL
jgi:cardiolipin synthase